MTLLRTLTSAPLEEGMSCVSACIHRKTNQGFFFNQHPQKQTSNFYFPQIRKSVWDSKKIKQVKEADFLLVHKDSSVVVRNTFSLKSSWKHNAKGRKSLKVKEEYTLLATAYKIIWTVVSSRSIKRPWVFVSTISQVRKRILLKFWRFFASTQNKMSADIRCFINKSTTSLSKCCSFMISHNN